MEREEIYKQISKKEREKFERNHEEIRIWINRARISETSKSNYYIPNLMRYCKYWNKTPKELLEVKEKDKRDNTHVAEDMLIEFLTTTEFKHNTKVLMQTTIKGFYEWNWNALERKIVKISLKNLKGHKTPKASELRQIERGLCKRDITMLRLLSCGFRRETLTKLVWNDIWDELYDEHNRFIWDGTTPIHIGVDSERLKGKGEKGFRGVEQHTFLYPNATKILLEYREELERKGIEINRDSPLLFTRNKEFGDYLKCSKETISQAIRKATNGKYSPHDFRRFIETQIEDSNVMSPKWLKRILGHTLGTVDNAYSQPKIEQLRKKFSKAIPYIDYTISESEVRNQDLQIENKQIRDMNKKLNQQLAIISSKVLRHDQILMSVNMELMKVGLDTLNPSMYGVTSKRDLEDIPHSINPYGKKTKIREVS